MKADAKKFLDLVWKMGVAMTIKIEMNHTPV
jgi:hypothetical protein